MDDFRYVGDELELFAGAVVWKRYVRRLLAPYVGGRVLEVGAGLGATTRALRDLGGASWTCLEPDAAHVAALSAQGVDARPGTIASLAPGERFDTILYIDVLEHIEDDAGELARAAAALAPGGRLVVLSPAHGWLFTPFDAAIGHHRRYSRAALVAVGPRAAPLERAFYADSVGLLASAANRFLLRSAMPTARQVQVWDRLMVPLSTRLDRLLGYRLGKSVVGIWRAPC